MYTIARGEDEYTTLVPRPASSVPTMGLYQNDELTFNYGSTDSGLASKSSDQTNIIVTGNEKGASNGRYINL